jgi:hypothetical protein
MTFKQITSCVSMTSIFNVGVSRSGERLAACMTFVWPFVVIWIEIGQRAEVCYSVSAPTNPNVSRKVVDAAICFLAVAALECALRLLRWS